MRWRRLGPRSRSASSAGRKPYSHPGSGLRAWEHQRAASEQMAVLVDRLAEIDGLRGPSPTTRRSKIACPSSSPTTSIRPARVPTSNSARPSGRWSLPYRGCGPNWKQMPSPTHLVARRQSIGRRSSDERWSRPVVTQRAEVLDQASERISITALQHDAGAGASISAGGTRKRFKASMTNASASTARMAPGTSRHRVPVVIEPCASTFGDLAGVVRDRDPTRGLSRSPHPGSVLAVDEAAQADRFGSLARASARPRASVRGVRRHRLPPRP